MICHGLRVAIPSERFFEALPFCPKCWESKEHEHALEAMDVGDYKDAEVYKGPMELSEKRTVGNFCSSCGASLEGIDNGDRPTPTDRNSLQHKRKIPGQSRTGVCP